jgi:high affinity sulfate transporter 1
VPLRRGHHSIWRGLLPGLGILRRYRREWLRLDLLAGLTVGAMLIPQSMAYAELAGMAPEYGFYAVIGALVVYALVGTSRHLGVGPEPGTAILAATGVGAIAAGDGTRYVALMAALALVVAAICIVAAIARFGFLASALSKPVLVGYITGVGLTLLSSQISAFSGVSISEDNFFTRFRELAVGLDGVHAATLAVGAATLVFILVLRRHAPPLPGALLGVLVASLVVVLLGDDSGVRLVGAIPGGLPLPRLPDVALADLGRLLPVAAGIAIVGYSDNVLTARSIAVRKGYKVDANQELLALGLTNLSSGFTQGFPLSSSASRTAVPAALGSKTQLVSLVAAACVVLTLVGAGSLLGEIPRAALAAVIVSAAIAIIDVAGYRSLWQVSREEFVLAVLAALGVIVFDVLTGVLIAVTLSIVVALFRIARPHDAVLGDYPELDGWVEASTFPEAKTEAGLLVYRFDAPLFFMNSERFQERVELLLAELVGEQDWVVLDFEGIGTLDATALDGLKEVTDRLSNVGVKVVAVARPNVSVVARLRRAGLVAPGGPIQVFPTINSAVRTFRSRQRS